jgi:hypothetical protein
MVAIQVGSIVLSEQHATLLTDVLADLAQDRLDSGSRRRRHG